MSSVSIEAEADLCTGFTTVLPRDTTGGSDVISGSERMARAVRRGDMGGGEWGGE